MNYQAQYRLTFDCLSVDSDPNQGKSFALLAAWFVTKRRGEWCSSKSQSAY